MTRSLDPISISSSSNIWRYDRTWHRVDIRLVSCSNQTVVIGSDAFDFHTGEAIHTEYSHKCTIQQFEQIASEADFHLQNRWTEDRQYFAVLYFTRQ